MRETGTGQQVAQLHDRYMMMMMIMVMMIHCVDYFEKNYWNISETGYNM
jgi:hypothetical protein